MAGLWWMAVTLFLLVYNGDSLPMDQNELAGLVTELLNRYRPTYEAGGTRHPMFSVAVSIPYNESTEKYDFRQVTDSGEDVRAAILRCEVYTGTRVVAATLLKWPDVLKQCPDQPVQWADVLNKCGNECKTWADAKKCSPKPVYNGRADHAEWRTLQHFNTLTRKTNDSLLFYVLASPCDQRCTNESNNLNILSSINEILRWDNYAVVFSKVFKPRGGKEIPEEERRGAIERLGRSVGLTNIFRCNGENETKCKSCSADNQVAHYCYDDKEEQGIGRGQGGNEGEQGMGGSQDGNGREGRRGGGPSQPQKGRSDSPSQNRQGGSGRCYNLL